MVNQLMMAFNMMKRLTPLYTQLLDASRVGCALLPD